MKASAQSQSSHRSELGSLLNKFEALDNFGWYGGRRINASLALDARQMLRARIRRERARAGAKPAARQGPGQG